MRSPVIHENPAFKRLQGVSSSVIGLMENSFYTFYIVVSSRYLDGNSEHVALDLI